MEALFLKILNMSLTASLVVMVLILLRALFPKIPKWIRVLGWAVVGARLVFPFSIESVLSLIPNAEPIPEASVLPSSIPSYAPSLDVEYDTLIKPGLPVDTTIPPEPTSQVFSSEDILFVLSVVWAVGLAVMLIYTVAVCIFFKYKLCDSTILYRGVKQSDKIDSPVVFGIFRPTIYLPYSIGDRNIPHVLAHERAHIKRLDHIIKPLSFLILSVYWFNPILWGAYILLCRDIEFACDEKAVKTMGKEERREYSTALLSCSVKRRLVAACPIAFGEVGVRERVKKVMNYKKPAFWITMISLVVLAVLAVCLITNPMQKEEFIGILKFVDNGSDFDGVNIDIENADSGDQGISMKVKWSNDTDKTVVFGEIFRMQKLVGEEWTDIDLNKKTTFILPAYLVNSGEAATKDYSLSFYFDISESGTYRFITEFSFHEDRNSLEPPSYLAWIDFEKPNETANVDIGNDLVTTPELLLRVTDITKSGYGTLIANSISDSSIYRVLTDDADKYSAGDVVIVDYSEIKKLSTEKDPRQSFEIIADSVRMLQDMKLNTYEGGGNAYIAEWTYNRIFSFESGFIDDPDQYCNFYLFFDYEKIELSCNKGLLYENAGDEGAKELVITNKVDSFKWRFTENLEGESEKIKMTIYSSDGTSTNLRLQIVNTGTYGTLLTNCTKFSISFRCTDNAKFNMRRTFCYGGGASIYATDVIGPFVSEGDYTDSKEIPLFEETLSDVDEVKVVGAKGNTFNISPDAIISIKKRLNDIKVLDTGIPIIGCYEYMMKLQLFSKGELIYEVVLVGNQYESGYKSLMNVYLHDYTYDNLSYPTYKATELGFCSYLIYLISQNSNITENDLVK